MQGSQGMTVLEVEAQGAYRPKTRETRAAYEAMLSFIQVLLCCRLQSVCCCLPCFTSSI